MSENQKRIEHPSWCDRARCTAPEFRPEKPTQEIHEHVSRELIFPGYAEGMELRAVLSKSVAPWDTATFLRLRSGNGQLSWMTEVGSGGVGFELFELLGETVKESVRAFPVLYAERFPYIERAIEEETDAATADAVMPRDPVELAEMISADSDGWDPDDPDGNVEEYEREAGR